MQLGGTDATAVFASSPHSASLLSTLTVVGSLEGYNTIAVGTSTTSTTNMSYDDDSDDDSEENESDENESENESENNQQSNHEDEHEDSYENETSEGYDE